MARTAEKVESLTAEDSEMEDALAVILAETDEGETVSWPDVRDDLSSGQWGRIIETGILVDGDGGFRIDDREAVERALDGSVEADYASSTDAEEIETTQWTQWDKGAALASLGLFAGYTFESVRDTIGSVIDVLLGPIEAVLPFYAVILIIALLTGLYSSLLQANLMDTEKMGKYQQRMKDIQERQKKAKERGDDEAVERIQEEQMEAMTDQLGMFKEQFRPMVWIMLLTIPFFLWMWWLIRDGPMGQESIILPIAGQVTWQQAVVGPIQVWIVWYFLCSMSFTQLIRKCLNIDMTPT